MNACHLARGSRRKPSRVQPSLSLPYLASVILFLSAAIGRSGGVVTQCTESNLRAAMAGGGLVTFACDGTIILTKTITNSVTTTLDGCGHQVTISGGNVVRVFHVATNITLTLIGLSVAHGHSPASEISPAEAGGILNLGNLNAIACKFRENVAEGPDGASPDPGTPACGGAILNANGANLNATGCSFLLNRANGGRGSSGWDGSFASSPTSGSSGGLARGGAIFNAGTMAIEASLFASNNVAGGSGGPGGNGGLLPYGTPATQPGGGGGGGGEGNGPAIFNSGTAFLVNCTFTSNSGIGGGGGAGGRAGIWETPHWAVGFSGGSGGWGGSASGAISDGDSLTSTLQMTNCTVAFNSSSSGTGGAGGSGSIGQPNGLPGSDGATGGGVNLNHGLLVNVLLATNTSGGNCSGTFTDSGHNLSSDSSGAFTNLGSLNNTDPQLGPLAANGGPTLTMAFSLASPALNAADNTSAPPTDQRGFPRPVGAAADIGAFEVGPARLQLRPASDGGLEITAFGIGGQRFCLMTSSNLATWLAVSTNQFDSTGIWTYHPALPSGPVIFYRLVAP